MPCQSRFVGFLIVPLQLAREHDSILIDVLALHCMHKKHLICFYKNLHVSDFHPNAHLLITECFEFLLWCPILEYLIPLSCYVRGHLEQRHMQQMQWRDRLALRDSCRAMDWPNYFPIDFLASRVAQDPHEQYRMSGLEPYASDSRGRLFCTQQSCNVCSLHRHWDWIPLSHSVCLCLPFPP